MAIYDFTFKAADAKETSLKPYEGKLLLIVNVASKCGLTPQYEGLEKLYETYKDRGLVIVGFPANNFNKQEPGTESEIKTFCTTKYHVTFPMMSKISVKGDDKHPLYKFLTEGKAGEDFAGDIERNFAKLLVDGNGNVMARFASKTTPDSPQLTSAVEKALAAGPSKQARAE